MRIKPLLFVAVLSFVCLFRINIASDYYEDAYGFQDDPSLVRKYTRFAEIEQQCRTFQSCGSELKYDYDQLHILKEQLSFVNGDWEQESGDSPLMPFDGTDMPGNNSPIYDPLKLVNFRVTDINPVRWKNVISLTGVVAIGITRNTTFGYDLRSRFTMYTGSSVLSIPFEGVYMETNENGGERLLCLLGNSSLPFRKSYKNASDLAMRREFDYNYQPPLLPDDQILLVLRYPQFFHLSNRAIYGEMSSLNKKRNAKFFDKVRISSHLDNLSLNQYQFHCKIASCNLEEVVEDGLVKFSALDFCKNLRSLSDRISFNIEPDFRFSGRYTNFNSLGPFRPNFSIRNSNWSYDDFRLTVQDIICEPESNDKRSTFALISAVIRLIPAPMPYRLAVAKTGLSDMTMSVEGLWNGSNGRLCMTGCLGIGYDRCDSRVFLYFPQAFSIKQRSLIFGKISSLSDSYIPITISSVIKPKMLQYGYYQEYANLHLSYNYSMIHRARAFRERDQQPSIVCDFMKLFPSLRKEITLLMSYADLSYNLKLENLAFPESSNSANRLNLFVSVNLLSLGPLVLLDSFKSHHSTSSASINPVHGDLSFKYTQLLNVSLHLQFSTAFYTTTAISYNNISELFLEGLYDDAVGIMYLTGCRKVLVESSNLERGLDCLIEVKIEYSPIIARWLKNPTARISVLSGRNKDDPLYFHPIYLKTGVLAYHKHNHDVIFRKNLENILRNLILMAEILTILWQLFHMKKKGNNVVSFISLVMIGMQVVGYILLLITGCEVLPKWKQSKFFTSYQLNQLLRPSKFLEEYLPRFLIFIALLLTTIVFQRVSESRKKLPNRRTSTRIKRSPSDKLVLMITSAVHFLGFLVFFIIQSNSLELDNRPDHGFHYSLEETSALQSLTIQLQDYLSLIQDLFLLPQVIENFLWRSNVKSLSKFYYIGYTSVRMIFRVYDFVKDPIAGAEFEFIEYPDFTTMSARNIAPVATMIILVIIVYIQQNIRHQKT